MAHVTPDTSCRETLQNWSEVQQEKLGVRVGQEKLGVRVGQEKLGEGEEPHTTLKRPTFNVWNVQHEEMLSLLEFMFADLHLPTYLKMEDETIRNFLKSVQSHYRENPFHNFRHAFCVTQMMYSMIHLCCLQEGVSPEDIAVLMVGALCHDLDHPGLNNAYQVNAQTELAVRYQNKSPLENHHCAIALQILSQSQSNIFCNVEPDKAKHILEGIAELILATDMTHHGSILQALQEIQNFSFSNTDHVTVLKKGLIKFSDISNEARPAEQAEIWADVLMEEYFLQSDREKAEGLPVTPYMDRYTVTKAESQKSFIQFMLLPLCQALCKIFPQLDPWALQPLMDAKLRYERQVEILQSHKESLEPM